jgi:hypothetical protein
MRRGLLPCFKAMRLKRLPSLKLNYLGTEGAVPFRLSNSLSGGRSMDCVLNHCHPEILGDIVVVAIYGVLVACMFSLAAISKSVSIRTSAIMVSLAWLLLIGCYFYLAQREYFMMVLFVDGLLAYRFWRMARIEIYPSVLCVIMLAEIAFTVMALSLSWHFYWIAFVMNRFFELTLLYIIGCAIFRIRVLRREEKTQKPASGWQVRFVAGAGEASL